MTALMNEQFLITPEMHRTLTDIVKAHGFGGQAEADQHIKAQSYGQNPAKKAFQVLGNSTAVIPCEGVIGRKFDDVLYSSGVTSIDIFERLVNTAADDDEIDSILFNFDSPGGTVTGVPEAAEAVRRAKNIKPVIAYADGQMCSAAYYIASQATYIYALPSAQVGSIGVYLALLDYSRAAEMAGIKVELFKSGKNKGMGTPGTALSEEQRAMLQAKVDKTGAQFRATVNEGRGRTINPDVMQGQSFDTGEAKLNGLIDEIASFDQALLDVMWLGKTGNK